jgi:GNAT superfamily N-acetyltransferase
MNTIIQELGTPAMMRAMEANFTEEMMCFGRVLPGGEIHEDAELGWFYTGRPHLNDVTYTHLAQNTYQYVNTKINEVFAYFSPRNVSVAWVISPISQPAQLGEVLEARGFTHVGGDSNMAVDLQLMNESISVPENLVIREIEDAETLKIHNGISKIGFESSAETAQSYYECYVGNGFGRGKPWHHYLAWLHSKPVGIASLLLHAGVAGIYGVATQPEARRQGVGADLTLHAMREARSLGYRIAILAPSEMGMNMYRSLGFQEMGNARYYRWWPTQE